MLLKVIVFIFFSATLAENVYFNNYTLYKLLPKNDDQFNIIKDLYNNDQRFNIWDAPSRARSVNVLSSPGDKLFLETFLKNQGIASEIVSSNIQTEINKQKVGRYIKNNLNSMTWDAYYGLEDTYDWLDDLIEAYPEATEIIGGTSYEKQPIKGIKISHGSDRRAIFIEGGIHPREWISPATVNYITNELLTSSDPEIRAAAREFDWYIFPITNPDGYLYSFTDSGRMWRKNRRPVGRGEIGVDLNRNWNDNWLIVGASDNPAHGTYAGHGPFSEIETRSISKYMMDMREKIELYLSFHSFGQMLLIPFGNTTEPLANYEDAMQIGRKTIDALKLRHGTEYTLGNIAETIYEATGGSIDWAKERLKIPLIFCYELRDRRNGNYGFLLPENQILPNSEETMDSIVAMIKEAKNLGYMGASESECESECEQ